jgi:type 2 lantibiotic biosynthesis protein LanM
MNGLSILPTLYNALTLRERTLWVQASSTTFTIDPLLAQKRVHRWRAQPPFSKPALFQQRLALDNLTTDTFGQILGSTLSPASTMPKELSPWGAHLAAFWVDEQARSLPARPPTQIDAADNSEPKKFSAVLTPLITQARRRLHDGLATLLAHYRQHSLADSLRADLPGLEAMLYADFSTTLERMLTPTLALELNIARLQGKLVGATPEERFAAYIEQLRQPQVAQPLIVEYPVLFRLAAASLERWVQVSLEIVARLCQDWDAICATFFAGQPPRQLRYMDRTQNTTKRGGRCVVILEFDSCQQLVYKPHSLALEGHFQQLLAWLNQCGHQPPFRLLTLLDRGDYGWVEFIDSTPCTTEVEVERFYQRQGAYLALLYALEATDFHLSNVIAAGEHPMLIDLEALFHPRDAEPEWLPLELEVDRATYHSVLRTGLLPEPQLTDDKSDAPFDASGLAGSGGQRTPYALPRWEMRGTDAMRRVYKHVTIEGGENLPILRGQVVNAADYGEAIDQGFVSLYHLLIRRRSELLTRGGPLATFANDEVRVIPRSGRRYSELLEGSFHPDLMRDALDRDRFLDRLWVRVEREPYLARLIAYEQSDLLEGDVPLFTTQAASRAVYSSRGHCIPDFFPHAGLELAYQRIMALDESDLARQRWFIQAALATVAARGSPAAEMKSMPAYAYVLPTVVPGDLQQQLLDQACAIAARLQALALCAGGEATWLGVSLIADRHWLFEPLGSDLYNGLPGVALFLAYLAALTGEERWTALAQAAVATLRRTIMEEIEAADAFPAIGAFDGLGGQLYTFAHLAFLWQDPSMIEIAEELAHLTQSLLQKSAEGQSSGLAHGIAGLLAGLLALYQLAPTPSTLQSACQAGEQLLHSLQSRPQENTPSLSSPPASTAHPFADFLNGLSGVSWPLLALAEVSGSAHWRSHAMRLWADAITQEGGSAGHWRASLCLLPWLDEPQRVALGTAFKMALPTMPAKGLGHNHSLGHGDLGYFDLLIQATMIWNDNELRDACGSYAAAIVVHMQRNGWMTAIPLGVESPGLMTGLAGIGYGLLRLAAPERVPSLLALALGTE